MDKAVVQKSPRRAGLVTRYHTWIRLRDQSVAEHTWQLMRIYVQIFGAPRVDVWMHILKHDMGEVQTGDVPYPAKANSPVLKEEMDRLESVALASMGIQLPELTEQEHLRFKFCDLLECCEYALDEILTGNRFMEAVLDQLPGLTAYLQKMTPEDRNLAVHYCGDANIPLDRDYLHSVNPLLRLAYDDRCRESANNV